MLNYERWLEFILLLMWNYSAYFQLLIFILGLL